ncbi:MAG: DUF2244 domain-containing protein [Proteobacteria bacterium]|nr:DUF2244 domain-containing protein [Pseudomonadota bacterium]
MSNRQNWSITLTPHRALSRSGFIAVMAVIAAFNFVGGLFFYLHGAWPVSGFMGLDVLLMWLAFKWNFRDGQRAERIIAEDDLLRLVRIDPRGHETEQRFNRRWVQVDLAVDEERELTGSLSLRSHGQNHPIASFLGAEERQSLAKALRAAL